MSPLPTSESLEQTNALPWKETSKRTVRLFAAAFAPDSHDPSQGAPAARTTRLRALAQACFLMNQMAPFRNDPPTPSCS